MQTGALSRQLVTFSAETTTNDQDAREQLQFRWDTNGDGTIDLSWGGPIACSRRFLLAGVMTVTVEARDSWGAVGRAEVSIEVVAIADAGNPARSHPAWRLPYAVADAAFDPVRPNLWMSAPAGQAVVRVDLNTGLVMVTSGPRLGCFNRETRKPIHAFQLGRPATWLGVGALEHYGVGVSGELTVIQRRVLPPESAEENEPPRIRWLTLAAGAAFAWPSTILAGQQPPHRSVPVDWFVAPPARLDADRRVHVDVAPALHRPGGDATTWLRTRPTCVPGFPSPRRPSQTENRTPSSWRPLRNRTLPVGIG